MMADNQHQADRKRGLRAIMAPQHSLKLCEQEQAMASNRFGKKAKKAETEQEKKERKEKQKAQDFNQGQAASFKQGGGAAKFFNRRTSG